MKQLRHRLIAPMTIGAIIALLILAALSAAGIQAVDHISHPSDVFTVVYRNASPSVVAISVETEAGGGNGSGFVIDRDGHIVTNAHVVDGAQEIVVNFINGAKVRGTIVGIDKASDLAVVKVDLPAAQLSPITFADSQDLGIGQTVLAIGSPFGQGWTLTSGIISALDRRIRGLTEFSIGGVIQTDASINPGNSGGPLINLDGEVIGVNSQIISDARSSAGVGFAIPSNLARRVARSLIESGEMRYSLIGLTGFDVSLTVTELLRLPNNFRGVVVREILDDGPAAASDLREIAEMRTLDNEFIDMRVDIITAVDGVPINGMNDLITYLARKTHPHQVITLSVLRNGIEELKLPLTLGSR